MMLFCLGSADNDTHSGGGSFQIIYLNKRSNTSQQKYSIASKNPALDMLV